MPTDFDWVISVDGTDVSDFTLEGASISYGRNQVGEQPSTSVAVLQLMTEDLLPDVGATYPEFGLGNHSMPTGYADTYVDTYAGPSSRITIGAPVIVKADTPGGYEDTYTDTYYGDTHVRFTGYIVAIDYTWDLIQLTCVTPMEQLARVMVGDTQTAGTEWPQETDLARAVRIWDDVTLVSGTALQVVPREGMRAESAFALIQQLAESCEALAYCTRIGTITYRSRDAYTPVTYTIPVDLIARDQLKMSLDLADLNNTLIVEYGTGDVLPTVTATDAASVTSYGLRYGTMTSLLAVEADAQAFANRELARREPGWHMPDLTVNFALASDTQISHIASLDMGDTITIPALLDGSPVPDYTAEVLGYTESLSRGQWTITFHLTPAGPLTP